MKVYTIIQQGVYRHTLGGVFDTLDAAVAAADDIAMKDRDNYHSYDVHEWTLNEHPASEHEVYSIERRQALLKRASEATSKDPET